MNGYKSKIFADQIGILMTGEVFNFHDVKNHYVHFASI